MHLIKLISSVSPTEADHHRLFPKKETVHEVLEGLCTVCNLGKPTQGWPQFPFDKKRDKRAVLDRVEGLESEGMHFLGLYHFKAEPAEATDITLFISRCLRTGDKLGLERRHIIDVVLIHEAAHYITHLGKCIVGRHVDAWPEFVNDEDAIEDVAQSATYFYLKASVDHARLHSFEILSRHQPNRYKTWDKWKARQTTGDSFWQCLKDF